MDTKMRDYSKEIGRSFPIEDGPSRDRLIDAFKYAYDKGTIIGLDFKVALGYTGNLTEENVAYILMPIKDFVILNLGHEDDSGATFDIKGSCLADSRAIVRDQAEYSLCRFSAYYNAKTRKGCIKLFE